MQAYFVNPAMLAGLALLAIPIIIHLIHRLRYKRVRWAPIVFLLESQRRNRRRILIEQLLLLLLRCLLIAGIVAIVARPLFGRQWQRLLTSGTRVEHLVLLDDSCSMRERVANSTAFAQGVDATASIVNQLAQQTGDHRLTVFRTSDMTEPAFQSLRIDPTQSVRLIAEMKLWEPTFGAADPSTYLAELEQFLKANESAQWVLYWITDFREIDWPDEAAQVESLRRMESDQVRLNLIDAGSGTQPNLAAHNLTSETGLPAAGIPFTVRASVASYGKRPAESVNVAAAVNGKPLPARTIERIEPGKTADVEFDLTLTDPGSRQVSASVPDDVLNADNTAWTAVDVALEIPLLIIDGSTQRDDSSFLSLALDPGGSVSTGLRPEVRAPESLKSATLEDYAVVYLLNVGDMEKEAAHRLNEYVRGGGGLAVFVGDQVRPENYNRYFDPELPGFVLSPLGNPQTVEPDAGSGKPDLQLTSHPVFSIFAGERNPFVDTVRVNRYFGIDSDAPTAADYEVIARHASGAPLALDAVVGKGRVFWFFSTLGPSWNNWCRNPSFVVAMLELNRYLASPVEQATADPVGAPIQLTFNSTDFRRAVRLQRPGAETEETLQAQSAGTVYRLTYDRTDLPGVYRFTRTTSDGEDHHVWRIVNVAPSESRLGKVAADGLFEILDGVTFDYFRADSFQGELQENRFEPRDWLILAFALILLAEQLLAYRLSYHLS